MPPILNTHTESQVLERLCRSASSTTGGLSTFRAIEAFSTIPRALMTIYVPKNRWYCSQDEQ